MPTTSGAVGGLVVNPAQNKVLKSWYAFSGSLIQPVPHGLVLVIGPTGSGKSSTLAAVIQEINQSRKEHILTIEDPIEYIYSPSVATISQRELGLDTNDWAGAMKVAMRQDPDVILVGEMRDLETISAAITLAETGHFGICHSSHELRSRNHRSYH